MGRPGYAPGDLLKLYIYGYLNRVRGSSADRAFDCGLVHKRNRRHSRNQSGTAPRDKDYARVEKT
jgi:hypothetical protein